jgi:hypothetical protein
LDSIPIDPHAVGGADRLIAEGAGVIDGRFGLF